MIDEVVESISSQEVPLFRLNTGCVHGFHMFDGTPAFPASLSRPIGPWDQTKSALTRSLDSGIVSSNLNACVPRR
jgi:hypothetical protein